MSTLAVEADLADAVPLARAEEANRVTVPAAEGGWEVELSGWRVALAQAERANRNLIQYAAAFAAVLGIGAGSGGVFAMAKAINKSGDGQLVPDWVLTGAFIVAAVTAVVLVCLLWSAYRNRRRAERSADQHYGGLIQKRPELFLPRHT
jgi:hypothetical protein